MHFDVYFCNDGVIKENSWHSRSTWQLCFQSVPGFLLDAFFLGVPMNFFSLFLTRSFSFTSIQAVSARSRGSEHCHSTQHNKLNSLFFVSFALPLVSLSFFLSFVQLDFWRDVHLYDIIVSPRNIRCPRLYHSTKDAIVTSFWFHFDPSVYSKNKSNCVLAQGVGVHPIVRFNSSSDTKIFNLQWHEKGQNAEKTLKKL